MSAEPELSRFNVTEPDANEATPYDTCLVIASDGLWDVVDEAQRARRVQ